MTANANKDGEQNARGNGGATSDSPSTLVPMLVGGLVLIIVGMALVAIFV
jgi:hypothetical protein